MSKRAFVFAALAACAFLTGSIAVAEQPSVPTLQQCAAQLPKGKTYSFSLTGTIDTSSAQPRLSGNLSVSDQTTVDRSQEGAAFAQCVGRLIR